MNTVQNKKKLLMIIPELGYGGAARSFSYLSVELAKYFDIKIITFILNDDYPVIYPLGGELICLNISKSASYLEKILAFRKRVKLIKQIKLTHNIDISISFLQGADYVNILSKVTDKVILSIRGSKTHDGNLRSFIGRIGTKILIPYLYPKADSIVSLSNGIKHELMDIFSITNVRHKVISNFYYPKKLKQLAKDPVQTELSNLLNSPYLVICSRLAREKNILPLIKVFAEIHKNNNLKLLIVGDGPELEKIPALCANLSLNLYSSNIDIDDSAVICIGAQTNPFKYIVHAQAFIMASESEGFGNSLVEALILSVPVISADCPWGPREILEPKSTYKNISKIQPPVLAEYGVLMPMLTDNDDSIKNWAIQLQKILEDDTLLENYRKKSQEAIARYTKENIIQQWLDVINN